MAFCLAELNLWSSRSSLNVQDADIGAFQFYEKGEPAFPTDHHYYNEKQQFVESRGYPWFLSNRRPEKLRDALKELEELLQSNSCVCTKWRTKLCCQMLLSSGVFVTLTLTGSQLERVAIDKTIVGRLPADTISHAVIGERFILLSLVEKNQVCQVYLGRLSPNSPELSVRLEKLSHSDIKISSVELVGSSGRRTDRHVALNHAQDIGLCWWHSGNDEMWPWSPVTSIKERTNLVLLGFSDGPGLMILSSVRTDGDPLDCRFSLTQPYQILTVELLKQARLSNTELPKQSQYPRAELHKKTHNSKADLQEDVHITQTCVYECARGGLQHLLATPLSLSSVPMSWCWDRSERWLLLGLQDCSVVLIHIETGVQAHSTCPMMPSLLAWHPDGGLIVVAGGQAEIQCFDLGLTPLGMQLVSEEEVKGKSGPSLQLARHVRITGGLEGVDWAHSSVTQGAEGLEVHDLLLLRFHRGPLATLKLRLGVLNRAQLGSGELLQQRLHSGEVDAALGILSNMDWCMMAADCYRGLISVTDHLLRQTLDEQTEAQLEAALGVFYSSSRSLTDTVILEYRDPISRYARRFFHHLVRYQRFEKAFLLALDIGTRDLFMDLHYVARDSGEPVLANVALRKAQELEVEGVTSSDPDESQPTPNQNRMCITSTADSRRTWYNPNQIPKNTKRRVVSSGRTSRGTTDVSESPIRCNTWPWTQTEISVVDSTDQVSENFEKLKVIHFGLV